MDSIKTKPQVTILKPPIPLLNRGELGVIAELIVRDKNGKVTDHRLMKCHSFVKQFLQLLYVAMGSITRGEPESIRGTDNVLESVNEYFEHFKCDALAIDDTLGSVVGTGTTAPAIDDYKLESKILHGVGAGQLQYGAVSFAAPASDAVQSILEVSRNFSNGSGGDITVNEIGLYVRVRNTSDFDKVCMAIRDVISGGIAVPNGQALTLNYRETAVV